MFETVLGALTMGFLQTLKLFAVTLIGAIPLGLVVSFGSMSRFTPLRWLTRTVVWVIRGTPLMLQLLIIFFIPGQWLGSSPWPSGESGRFLAAAMTLLQMIKRIVPPMSNEIITLVKDTSIARIISLQEVIWAGYAFLKGSHGYSGLTWPLFFTGVYYLVFNGGLTLLFGWVEKKLDYFR